jgi:hypothetical protein
MRTHGTCTSDLFGRTESLLCLDGGNSSFASLPTVPDRQDAHGRLPVLRPAERFSAAACVTAVADQPARTGVYAALSPRKTIRASTANRLEEIAFFL